MLKYKVIQDNKLFMKEYKFQIIKKFQVNKISDKEEDNKEINKEEILIIQITNK